MILLNSKSALDLEDDEESVLHVEEIQNLIGKIAAYRDYDCALLCKYQDVAHQAVEQEIRSCTISTILDEVESFDFKNGIDLGVQEGEYLILVVHGQGYTLKSDGSYHLVTLAMKIMPYDENHSFINVLPILNDQKPVIAHGL